MKSNTRGPILVPTLMALGMATTSWFLSSGPSLRVTFIPGVALAYLLFLSRFRREMPPPDRLLPLYLVGFAVQCLHFLEEYLTNFHERFPGLWGAPPYSRDLFVAFNLVAYALFALGALVLWRKIRVAAMVPLFFISYGVIGNAVGHVAFAVAARGYFPGLWTSLIYWVLGAVLLFRLWRWRPSEAPAGMYATSQA